MKTCVEHMPTALTPLVVISAVATVDSLETGLSVKKVSSLETILTRFSHPLNSKKTGTIPRYVWPHN